jgi:single-strand DNA-binding protein
MNRVVLIGRLTRDPELKYTPGTGTAVTTLTLAVDRRMPNKDGQREADFVPVVVWGKIAENVANYCSKGRLVGVSGRLQIRSYDGKDGIKRTVAEVVADEVQFLEKMNQGTKPAQSSSKEDSYEDMTPIEDGEIPF